MKIQQIPFYNPQKISRYLKSLPQETLAGEFPLDKVNIRELEGIQNGIEVFENVSMPEIKFITRNFSILNLARNCAGACTHCLRNASSAKPVTMLWENLTRFTEGFEKLNERLGFDTLKGNKYMVLHDDSNPPEFLLKDMAGISHNFADAVKVVFEKLRIPVETVTTGWNRADLKSERAAKELVDYFIKTPDSNALVAVSVNPFHGLLEKSRLCANSGKPDTAVLLREVYIDRIAHTIETFLPVFQEGKGSLIYRYAPSGNETGAAETAKLYREIYAKLKKLIGKDKLAEIKYLKPENFETGAPEHLIEPKGRGRKYFSPVENLEKQQELIAEKAEWETTPTDQKISDTYKYTIKEVDIDGKVYARTTTETVIPTDIQLNFTPQKTPEPLFSDIKLSELTVRGGKGVNVWGHKHYKRHCHSELYKANQNFCHPEQHEQRVKASAYPFYASASVSGSCSIARFAGDSGSSPE